MTEFAQGVAWAITGVFALAFAFVLTELAKQLVNFRRWRHRSRRDKPTKGDK